jgi:peptidylprolyl isomerase
VTEVKNGDTVRLHYTAKLTDGTEFESSTGREPLEIQVGAGQIIPGLDQRISGMNVGEETTVKVPASEAYGPHDDAQVQTLPRSAISPGVDVEVGTRLRANTQDGGQIALTVVKIDDEQVTVDANHPLAGKDLVFDVRVLEIVES